MMVRKSFVFVLAAALSSAAHGADPDPASTIAVGRASANTLSAGLVAPPRNSVSQRIEFLFTAFGQAGLNGGIAGATSTGVAQTTAGAPLGTAASLVVAYALSDAGSAPIEFALASANGGGFGASLAYNLDATVTTTAAGNGAGSATVAVDTAGDPSATADSLGSGSGSSDAGGGGAATLTQSDASTNAAATNAAGSGTSDIGFRVLPGSARFALDMATSPTDSEAETVLAFVSGMTGGIVFSGGDAAGAFGPAGSIARGEATIGLGQAGSGVSESADDAAGVLLLADALANAQVGLEITGTGTKIETAGSDAPGAAILASSLQVIAASLALTGEASAITTAGESAHAAFVGATGGQAATSLLTLQGEGSRLGTEGNGAFGGFASAFGTRASAAANLVGDNVAVTTAGVDAIGVGLVSSGLDEAVAALSLEGRQGRVETLGDNAYGALIAATSASSATAQLALSGQDTHLATIGQSSVGAFVLANGFDETIAEASLDGASSAIMTAGDAAFGLFLSASGSQADAVARLSGQGSAIRTTGADAYGAALLSSASDRAIARFELSGENSLVSTAGDGAAGVFLFAAGADSRPAVHITGENAAITTSGDNAPAVILAGDNGHILLDGAGSGIHTTGNASEGVFIYGNTSLIEVGSTSGIATAGFNAPAIVLAGASGDHLIVIQGSLASAVGPAILGSEGTDTLVNSGAIFGGGGVAFDLGAGADAVSLLGFPLIEGLMRLGTGANTVTIDPSAGPAAVWTFDGTLPDSSVTVLHGAPFIVDPSTTVPGNVIVATVDPTALLLSESAVTGLVGGLATLIDGRLDRPVLPRPEELAFAEAEADPGLEAKADGALQALTGTHGGLPRPRAEIAAVWAKTFIGGWRDENDGALKDISMHYGGVAAGIDRRIGDDGLLGLFGGASLGRIDEDGRIQTIDTQGVFAGGYGRTWLGAVMLGVSVTGGMMTYDSRRTVLNNLAPGGMETATATYDSLYVSPEVRAAIELPLTPALTARPTVRLRSTALWVDGYLETGSAGAMTVADRAVQTLEGRLELPVTYTAVLDNGLLMHATGSAGIFAGTAFGDLGAVIELLGQELSTGSLADRETFGITGAVSLDLAASRNTSLSGSMRVWAALDGSIAGHARIGARIAF